MDEQKERAAFEAWCQSIGFTTWRSVEGDYLSNYGAELWSGWKARAALAAAPAPDEPYATEAEGEAYTHGYFDGERDALAKPLPPRQHPRR